MPRPRWRFNAAYAVTPRFTLGVEYNLAVSELNPTGNWIATPETEKWPMVSFGTSSDRIFTPEGNQAYFVSFAKSIPALKAAPYVSINYSEYERGLNFPFGVNVGISPLWDVLLMNDGRKTHVLLNYKQRDYNISFMGLDLEKPKFGISVGWGIR